MQKLLGHPGGKNTEEETSDDYGDYDDDVDDDDVKAPLPDCRYG